MKKMKRLTAMTAALALSVSAMGMSAFAEESDAAQAGTAPAAVNVYVTIADGEIKLANQAVSVEDIDGDNALTINDALYAAHKAYYEGGAEAGYGTAETQWGLSLAKLWGVENGGSYGYYVNNKSAWSLADTVAEGDFINAFVYSDTVAFSDAYSFFDKSFAEIDLDKEETLELTLSYVGFDADYNPLNLPVKGAYITLNGEKTEFVTDDEGKVTVTLDKGGDYVVSAVSDTQTLVPPALNLSALKTDEPEETGDGETEGENEGDGETETGTDTEGGSETKNESNEGTGGSTTENPKTSEGAAAMGLVSVALAGLLVFKRRK